MAKQKKPTERGYNSQDLIKSLQPQLTTDGKLTVQSQPQDDTGKDDSGKERYYADAEEGRSLIRLTLEEFLKAPPTEKEEKEAVSVFRSILVPLDRSSFAEGALPLARGIARRAGARLDLATVHTSYDIEERIPVGAHFDPDRDAGRRRQEQSYLDALAAGAAAEGVEVTTAVLDGSAVLPETVADGLLNRARAEQVDLIVMATHGRGAFGRLAAAGSVADELIRRGGTPVLLVNPDRLPAADPQPAPRRFLVALNGSAAAERVLEPALALAALTQARCDLLRVVESHPAAAGVDDPQQVAVARDYLARVAAMVSERGLPAGWRVAVAPSAAAAIIAEAEANDHDLVAMSAEGHSRLGRLVLGSTPEKVILGVRAAVLAYRPASQA